MAIKNHFLIFKITNLSLWQWNLTAINYFSFVTHTISILHFQGTSWILQNWLNLSSSYTFRVFNLALVIFSRSGWRNQMEGNIPLIGLIVYIDVLPSVQHWYLGVIETTHFWELCLAFVSNLKTDYNLLFESNICWAWKTT